MAALTNKATPAGGRQLVGKLTYSQIEAFWIQAGGASSLARVMAAITSVESNNHTDACAYDPNRYTPPSGAGAYGGAVNQYPGSGALAVGLWQINIAGNPGLANQGYTAENLLDPLTNARAAVALAGAGGSGITSSWSESYAAAQGYLPNVPNPPTNIQGTLASANTGSGGGGGFFSGVQHAIGQGLGDALSGENPLAQSLGIQPSGGQQVIQSGVSGLIGGSSGSIGKDILYGGTILGGGLIMILGVVLIAADIGLSTFAAARRGGNEPAVNVETPETPEVTAANQRKAEAAQRQQEHREAINRARLREARAKARTHEAHARTAAHGTSEAKRRSERARGITSSEIAQLQMGQ